jgi:hypothetical protein
VRRISAEFAFISANGELGIRSNRLRPLYVNIPRNFAGRPSGGGRGDRGPLPCFDSVLELVQSFRNLKEDLGDAMNIEEIINKPITTPHYPDPTEARRYLDDPDGFYGYDYVFLEDATWSALCEIADERGCTVDELCKDIEFNFAPDESFTPSARRYVMRYLAGIPDNIELPRNFRVLSELLDERRRLA